MEGRLLARARNRLEAIRSDNRAEENRRHAEIYALIPEIRTIDAKLRGHMTELVGLALGQPGRNVTELERENLSLQSRRAELLRLHGYTEDYLDPIYSCPLCRDTGWHDDTICSCLEALYKQEQTNELAPLLGDGTQSFDRFSLQYYAAAPLASSGTSPRQRMEGIFAICRGYADHFGEDSENLLFTGAPGLGKTFLSASIARVVAQKNFSVAYDTASGLLGVFEKEKFSRDTDEQSDAASRVRQLISCDLLILDDLGTEMSTAFTQSALYTLIDGRLRGGKKTVISTNLSPDEIGERYGAQLASRINGEYLILSFIGRDIRALRKEQSGK